MDNLINLTEGVLEDGLNSINKSTPGTEEYGQKVADFKELSGSYVNMLKAKSEIADKEEKRRLEEQKHTKEVEARENEEAQKCKCQKWDKTKFIITTAVAVITPVVGVLFKNKVFNKVMKFNEEGTLDKTSSNVVNPWLKF